MTVSATRPRETPQVFQKAELAIESGEVIQCLFNPTEYSISKANTWNFKAVTGSSLPKGQFGGGNPRVLQLTLLLDVSLLGPKRSVRDVTDKLFEMMEVPTGQGAGGPKAVPPMVTFRWGSVDTFMAVCTSLTVAFQLFHPNGEPIRAEVKLELKQARPASSASTPSPGTKTNPTTRSRRGLGVHTVADGDSLASIAYATYGDPTQWRTIAEENGIDDPMRLRRGSELVLPVLED
jgi:hypothetical protein